MRIVRSEECGILMGSATVSGRAGSPNVGTVSDFSCTTSLMGWKSGLASPNSSLTCCRPYMLWSGWFYFRRSGNYFRLSNYFWSGYFRSRFFGGTSAFPSMWTEDHGAGLCHYGRQLNTSGRRYRNRLASGRLATTLRSELESMLFPLL